MKNVLEYLEASALGSPDKIAVKDDKESCTYSELLNISKALGFLLSSHIHHEKPVAVMLKKSVLTLEMFFGSVYAGGFYSLIDPDFPVPRIRNILSVLEPEAVITSDEYLDKLKESGYEGNIFIGTELRSSAALQDPDSEELRKSLSVIREKQSPSAPLYCNFTSGSTGVPKGVLVGHASVISFIDSFTELFNITGEDIIGNQAPFDFDVSVKDIYSCMKCGATMVIIPTAFFRLPNGVMDLLDDNKVTTLIWAVSALVLLNRLHEFMYKIPSCINKVLFSGEEMPPKHLADWMNVYPDAEFVNLYGPTEVTCNCSYYRVPKNIQPEEKLPAGFTFPGKTITLLGDDGNIIPNDSEEIIGEICVGGNELALGYYRNPEVTNAAFIESTDSDGSVNRLYKTGDLGYWKDGLLYFAGRRDFQIKHNGHRIELEEIERALNSLPEILQACCIYDEARYRIIAFCTGTNDKKLIVEGLKKTLPDYMLPNIYKFMDELPLTKNGKIDRNNLRSLVTAKG